MTRRPRLGIPYAPQDHDGKDWYVTCPVCQARIVLRVRKDFESFRGGEYALHYFRVHEPNPCVKPVHSSTSCEQECTVAWEDAE